MKIWTVAKVAAYTIGVAACCSIVATLIWGIVANVRRG